VAGPSGGRLPGALLVCPSQSIISRAREHPWVARYSPSRKLLGAPWRNSSKDSSPWENRICCLIFFPGILFGLHRGGGEVLAKEDQAARMRQIFAWSCSHSRVGSGSCWWYLRKRFTRMVDLQLSPNSAGLDDGSCYHGKSVSMAESANCHWSPPQSPATPHSRNNTLSILRKRGPKPFETNCKPRSARSAKNRPRPADFSSHIRRILEILAQGCPRPICHQSGDFLLLEVQPIFSIPAFDGPDVNHEISAPFARLCSPLIHRPPGAERQFLRWPNQKDGEGG